MALDHRDLSSQHLLSTYCVSSADLLMLPAARVVLVIFFSQVAELISTRTLTAWPESPSGDNPVNDGDGPSLGSSLATGKVKLPFAFY
jgi:hypothetical protein